MTTPERITAIVAKYHNTPKDTVDVDALIDFRRRLACLVAKLAVEACELYRNKNATEFSRKAQFARARQAGIKEGLTVSKADSEAHEQTIEALELEMIADGEYKSAALIIDAANGVLDAIAQHIANLRSEKAREMSGGGTQG